MPRPKVYLLSRTLDPMLGVFTGLLAYYLNETNPRSAPPPGHTLRELLGWQWGVMRDQRAERERLNSLSSTSTAADNAETGEVWEGLRREFEGKQAEGVSAQQTAAAQKPSV